MTRFFGLFGIYYSLQFLSLSDATVITFLAPLCTGIAGALLLKESFTKKEALASCESHYLSDIIAVILNSSYLVFSLCGVILIARPVFLFGGDAGDASDSLPVDGSEKGTPAERLVAVGFVIMPSEFLKFGILTIRCSVALLGVLGSTGACNSFFSYQLARPNLTCACLRYLITGHRKTSAPPSRHDSIFDRVSLRFYDRVSVLQSSASYSSSEPIWIA